MKKLFVSSLIILLLTGCTMKTDLSQAKNEMLSEDEASENQQIVEKLILEDEKLSQSLDDLSNVITSAIDSFESLPDETVENQE